MNKFTDLSLIIGFLLTFGSAPPALAQQSQIAIAYEKPSNTMLQPIYEELRGLGALEKLQSLLRPLRLPRPITIRTAQCDSASLSYSSGGPVTLCYEVFDQVKQLAEQHSKDEAYRQTLLYGAVIQAALRETAVAIFDVLQIPIWGREFDAADRLAALIMTQFGEDVMKVAIESTSQLFQWSDRKWTGQAFASIESPEAQRFYNYLCIAYAAAPFDFSNLVSSGILPKIRANQCDNEYKQIKKAFNLRIMPYIDPDVLVETRTRPWLSGSRVSP